MTQSKRKERILGVAERLFSHYGPAKTTVADIAKACGIGVGSVYLDFPSKEAILSALSSRKVQAVADEMRSAATSASRPHRVVQMLEARVAALFDLAAAGQHGCDLVRCEQQSVVPSFGGDVRALLVEELGALRGHGELRAAWEPHAVVSTLEVAFAALTPPALFLLSRERAVADARALAELVVFGLTP